METERDPAWQLMMAEQERGPRKLDTVCRDGIVHRRYEFGPFSFLNIMRQDWKIVILWLERRWRTSVHSSFKYVG